jgi:phage terminase large subunit
MPRLDSLTVFTWALIGAGFLILFVWVKLYYNSSQKKLYIFDELWCNKKSNEQTAQILKTQKKVDAKDLIIADSAEAKSIADFKKLWAFLPWCREGTG